MSVEKFNRALEAAAVEAAKDLPLVLAQWQQGQNPDHAKVIRSLEGLLAADSGLDESTRAILEARAEAMRPKLNWDKKTVERMVALVMWSDIHDHEVASQVRASVLKSTGSPGGSGRGRKPGSVVTKVEGAAEQITLSCGQCDWSDTKKSASASSPQNLASYVASHLKTHDQKLSGKALVGAIKSVIMGEKESLTIHTPEGQALITFVAVSS